MVLSSHGKNRTEQPFAHPLRPGKLHPGPGLPGHQVHYDEEHSTWVIDETLIVCTPLEYVCLKALLEQINHCVPFAQFEEYFWEKYGEQKTVRLRMRHLMSKLRNKLWPLGLEIASLRNRGYILLLESKEEAHAHHGEQISGRQDV